MRAFAAAFPELTDLQTRMAGAAHAQRIARELAERTPLLRRWTLEFFSDDPTPADAHALALALPGVTVELLAATK